MVSEQGTRLWSAFCYRLDWDNSIYELSLWFLHIKKAREYVLEGGVEVRSIEGWEVLHIL